MEGAGEGMGGGGGEEEEEKFNLVKMERKVL